MPHPLDRCVWNALHTRQAHLAIGGGLAVGYERSHAMFVAAADGARESLAALAALVPEKGQAALVEREHWPPPPGTRLVSAATIVQMVADKLEPSPPPSGLFDLGEADAAEMLELATLCRPGPFFARTHALGGFVGIRDEAGRLAALAGERMKPGRFTEVSAVCTRPEQRGRGLARGLISVVASRILGRGETPFLHSYPDNEGAIALYRSLGFERRAEVTYSIFERG